MTVSATYGLGYSAGAPAEAELMLKRRGQRLDGTPKLILSLHGRNGAAKDDVPFGAPSGQLGFHTWSLASEGYVLVAMDAGGPTTWGDSTVMSRIDDTIAWAATQGIGVSKVGFLAHSMGGIGALNWIKRNPSKAACAWMFAPVTDLDFFNGTAGYVPAYSTGGIALGAYAADIAADYNPYASASVGWKVHDEPASWRGICPINLTHADDDAVVPVAQSTSFVANVNDSLVTFREVGAGGHLGLFSGVPALEVIRFFKAAL